MLGKSILLATTLVVCWQCLLQEVTASSFMMQHPQEQFCAADYVFRFVPMSDAEEMPAGNSRGRTKRLVPMGMMKIKRQMVQVKRFYKGEKMVMPMMKMAPAKQLEDAFSPDRRKIEASIRLGMYQKPLKKGQTYIFVGRMYRYRNNTMKPASEQIMMTTIANTMLASTLSKVIRRGLRKKYAQGCRTGCRVRTTFSKVTKKHKQYCYWSPNFYHPSKTDCRKTAQFCFKGKDGFCYWKKTKAYKKCEHDNKMP